MDNLFERVIGNYKTTWIGIVLLTIFILLMLFKIITPEEFGLFLPTIIGLFYVKDTILGEPK